MPNDPFDLRRFLKAQENSYQNAVEEMRAGRKKSHWMWFVFPQIAGLGMSAMSQRFAISGIDEARAYLAHPQLGARLRQCVDVLLQQTARNADDIFGSPDDMKLRSSLTLFARAAPEESRFHEALQRYFGGQADPATLSRL